MLSLFAWPDNPIFRVDLGDKSLVCQSLVKRVRVYLCSVQFCILFSSRSKPYAVLPQRVNRSALDQIV